MSDPVDEQCTPSGRPIDVDAMMKRCMGNPKIVLLMLEKFREQVERDLQSLKDAVPGEMFNGFSKYRTV
ncbi:MAG: hypothetical protein U0136_06260 [Bdellovibrionota bacterium]